MSLSAFLEVGEASGFAVLVGGEFVLPQA